MQVPEHQPGKAPLQRIRRALELSKQGLLRNVLPPKRITADFLKAAYHFKWAERFWSTELNRCPLCRRMSQRKGTDCRDVAVRDPTDRFCSRSIDASLGVCIIEAQGRAEPYFHKPTGLYDGEVQGLQSLLYLLLRVGHGISYSWRPPERDEHKPLNICVMGGTHKVQLSLRVHRLYRVIRLPAQG